MTYEIIYEDKALIVCRKPSGLAVQNASVGKKDLESMLKTYLFEQRGQANPYLGVVHRLDQPVQGLVVFAKDAKSTARLSAQAADGSMKKYYLAVVCGTPRTPEDTLTDYLLKDGRSNYSKVVSEHTPGAKRASLHYRVLRTEETAAGSRTLVEIELHTGRHHQIRVQMAAAGLPLFGDQKYNPGARGQIALCAYRLTFFHPRTGKEMTFTCEPEGEAFAI